MQLFQPEPLELLSYDGQVTYMGPVLDTASAMNYYEILMKDIAWKHDEAKIFGKHYITKRKVAWYGDHEYDYTYSNVTKRASIWTPELLALKNLVEKRSNTTYNSCLLNLYHDGSEAMAWHSDGEKTLKKYATIASMSFGAERMFAFKHKQSKERISIKLMSGSLLLMQGVTQEHWLHRLPPTKKPCGPRVNLTFRTILI
jgi:alkylated DNA repair dioxygenase AlkB